MKTPLGTEVDIGAGHIVLDGFPALRQRGTAPPPSFRPMYIVATVAHLSHWWALVYFTGLTGFQPTWRKRWFVLRLRLCIRGRTYIHCTEIRTTTPTSSETKHASATHFRYMIAGSASLVSISFIPCLLSTTRNKSTSAVTCSND